MTKVTLQAIEQLLDIKLDEKLDRKLEPIKKTLEAHSRSLDFLVTKYKEHDDAKRLTDKRLEKLEYWGTKVGKKVKIALEF